MPALCAERFDLRGSLCLPSKLEGDGDSAFPRVRQMRCARWKDIRYPFMHRWLMMMSCQASTDERFLADGHGPLRGGMFMG
jgi:hypothetical protein